MGALPLLYAFWGAAPAEIIEFLLESYQALYPGYKFNWRMMVETLGRCNTPKERIEYMLHVRQMHFPDQSIDWEYLLDKFAQLSLSDTLWHGNCIERMQFIFMCGMTERVEALPFKVWRNIIAIMIQTSNFEESQDNFPKI